MRLFIPCLSILFVTVSVALPTTASALDGREIMAKHEDARQVAVFTAKARLETRKANAAPKEKTFTIWRKLKADGIHFESLTRFHTPAEVKNEAILFLENPKGENDILLYLPAYQKVRRLERSQQSASFMGSDLSYSDITTPHVDDYRHKLEGEEACPGESTVSCYRIEGIPASDSIRERTGYARTLTWVRKDIFMPTQIQHFDAKGALVKTSALSEIEKLATGKWFTKKIQLTTTKTGGQSTLQFSDVRTDPKLDAAFFTQQALAKGAR